MTLPYRITRAASFKVMGAMISLPMFDQTLSNSALDGLLDTIRAAHPELERDVRSWEMHGHLNVKDGLQMAARVAALSEAIPNVDASCLDELEPVASRLEWLTRDLLVAPLSISDPIEIYSESANSFLPNPQLLVVDEGFEWSSARYLLGVLLSELCRLEGMSLDVASGIDRAGVLDLHDVELLEATSRTVDSILFGDAGRDFSPVSYRKRAIGLDEQGQFPKLQQLLAIHNRR